MMWWIFGVSPRALTRLPFSVSAGLLGRLLLPCSCSTSSAKTPPFAFCQGPRPIRSRIHDCGHLGSGWRDMRATFGGYLMGSPARALGLAHEGTSEGLPPHACLLAPRGFWRCDGLNFVD